MTKKILIIAGDPISINSEIIFKSWNKLSPFLKKKIIIISNFELLQAQFKKLKYSIKVKKIYSLNEVADRNILKVINISIKYKNPFKISNKNISKFVLDSLNLGHTLSLRKDVLGLINCPINKRVFNKKKIGVTEFLASKNLIRNNSEAMIIKSDKISVSPITTHIDIKDVSKKLKNLIIINKIKTIDKWFKLKLKKTPKIGVLGLNPHNAELRKDSEEKKIIIPSIKILKNLKIKVEGPLVADSIFVNNFKNFDILVGMYHDQVLIPIKSLYKFDAINITLGLKYLRVSPDHGVATSLINRNKADCSSLIKCIKFVNRFGQ